MDHGGPLRRTNPESETFLFSCLHGCPEPGGACCWAAGSGAESICISFWLLYTIPQTLLVNGSKLTSAFSLTCHHHHGSSSDSLYNPCTTLFFFLPHLSVIYLFLIEAKAAPCLGSMGPHGCFLPHQGFSLLFKYFYRNYVVNILGFK